MLAHVNGLYSTLHNLLPLDLLLCGLLLLSTTAAAAVVLKRLLMLLSQLEVVADLEQRNNNHHYLIIIINDLIRSHPDTGVILPCRGLDVVSRHDVDEEIKLIKLSDGHGDVIPLQSPEMGQRVKIK